MAGKCAIVTGASSGIGYASAHKFTEMGFNVLAVGRNEAALEELRDHCSAEPGQTSVHVADLKIESGLTRVVENALDLYGSIDVLVNSAGIIASGSIETTEPEDWDEMMSINLDSVFQLTRRCVPFLKESAGNVVNVSSVAGKRSFPNLLAYCVSKAAIDQFTRCVALELADKGVRVNAVNPGVVVSNLHRRSGMSVQKYAGFLEHSKSTHPLGRVGTPEEVADLIYFLASDAAGWITGATYEIDGGRGQTCAR